MPTEQDNQPVRPEDSGEVNDGLLERNELSQAEESASLPHDQTVDCNLKLSAHSQPQAVALR